MKKAVLAISIFFLGFGQLCNAKISVKNKTGKEIFVYIWKESDDAKFRNNSNHFRSVDYKAIGIGSKISLDVPENAKGFYFKIPATFPMMGTNYVDYSAVKVKDGAVYIFKLDESERIYKLEKK